VALIETALGIVATAVVKEAIVRPRQIGSVARAYCDRVRKPLLLISGPSILRSVVGPPVKAEATTSRAAPITVPNRTFGAVLAVGVLERQNRPDLVVQEWQRVADKVFVVVPPWWSPTTWLNPSNEWLIDPSLKHAAPLWNSRQRVYLLRMSDKWYGAGTWNQKNSTTTPPRITTRLSQRLTSQNPTAIPMATPDFRMSGPNGTSKTDSLAPFNTDPLPQSSDTSQQPTATHMTMIGDNLPDYDDLGSLPFE